MSAYKPYGDIQDVLSLVDLENDDYIDRITDYNKIYSNFFDDVVKKVTHLESVVSTFYNEDTQTTEDEETNENVLLISEAENKVVLPYTLEGIQKAMEENEASYDTVQDVIAKEYTKPLTYYKHTSLARFREAFKLVKDREGGSFFKAMDLALELFSNYNLHPAVISACKTVNELDVYLSCLEYNELDDFHFFKTIFKISPAISKTIKT